MEINPDREELRLRRQLLDLEGPPEDIERLILTLRDIALMKHPDAIIEYTINPDTLTIVSINGDKFDTT